MYIGTQTVWYNPESTEKETDTFKTNVCKYLHNVNFNIGKYEDGHNRNFSSTKSN